MSDVQYSTARLSSGEIVKVEDSQAFFTYYCLNPECNSIMIPRHKRNALNYTDHFAHKSLNPNCNPETALHNRAIKLLIEKMKDCLDKNKDIEMKWNCIYCNEIHYGKLLKNVSYIKTKYKTPSLFEPDIALFDSNHKLIKAIEIVVTHAPDSPALEYYKKNNICVIQFNIPIDSDLGFIQNKPLLPNWVSVCRNPRCNKCGNFKLKTTLYISDVKCYACGKIMKWVTSKRQGESKKNVAPNLYQVERKFAELYGAKFKYITDRGTGETGYGNFCLNSECNKTTAFYPYPKLTFINRFSDINVTMYYCKDCDLTEIEKLRFQDDLMFSEEETYSNAKTTTGTVKNTINAWNSPT